MPSTRKTRHHRTKMNSTDLRDPCRINPVIPGEPPLRETRPATLRRLPHRFCRRFFSHADRRQGRRIFDLVGLRVQWHLLLFHVPSSQRGAACVPHDPQEAGVAVGSLVETREKSICPHITFNVALSEVSGVSICPYVFLMGCLVRNLVRVQISGLISVA
jgi:hypothetical protein